MLIGVPRETKDHEYRVGLTPASVKALVARGHRVLVEHGAGTAAGFDDDRYVEAGAEIAPGVTAVYAAARMIVKVKEPEGAELGLLRDRQILFSYLHLVADAAMTRAMMAAGAVCIAYETIVAPDGSRPLLIPMSVIAGRLATQVGAHYLERPHGQRGLLIGGAPGAAAAKVAVLGAGTVGTHAAAIARGMQANVFAFDRSQPALEKLEREVGDVTTVLTTDPDDFRSHLVDADLAVGALLVPGGRTPQVADRATVAAMKPGAVIVDVAADQGGCFETSRPTTHSHPTYIEENVVHYCVSNMPGIVPRTSTLALNHATLPYIAALADKDWRRAMRDDPGLMEGLGVCGGAVTHARAAADLGLEYRDAKTLL